VEEHTGFKNTPLIEKHKDLGAKLAPFGGWLMPIQYSGIIEEHNWTRKSAGLFDICHMGEFEVEGDLDKINLGEFITVNLKAMPSGTCKYGFMLNEEGGIIDDLVVYRITGNKWMVVVNAATTDSNEKYLRSRLNSETSIKNVSGVLGKLDLQGPLSKKILDDITGVNINLEYYTFNYFKLLGENIIISRTGYTGELGYELYMPNEKVIQLWEKILSDSRVKPVGLGARDTLRLEMGYSLYGQDIDNTTSPLEVGLGSFIDWNKDFIGKEALLKQRELGLSRRIIYFSANSRRSPRHNYRINYKGSDIGIVTSGSFSPSLGVGIGMGYSKVGLEASEEIRLTEGAISIDAKVVKRPFYKNGSVKYKEMKNACAG
jgi:aminomethyltransferase